MIHVRDVETQKNNKLKETEYEDSQKKTTHGNVRYTKAYLKNKEVARNI